MRPRGCRPSMQWGVIPPDFAVERTLAMMDGMLAQEAGRNELGDLHRYSYARKRHFWRLGRTCDTHRCASSVSPLALKRQRDQIAEHSSEGEQ